MIGGRRASTTPKRIDESQEVVMPTYRMVYGDAEQVVRETYEDVDLQHEDGWIVLFRGPEAILRIREDHVQQLDLVG